MYPETLDYNDLHWEYDTTDGRYLFINEYISHELQQELFDHTQRLKARREKLLVTDGYTKDTVCSLETKDIHKDSSANDMYLVRRKSAREDPTTRPCDVDKLILQYTNLEESELRECVGGWERLRRIEANGRSPSNMARVLHADLQVNLLGDVLFNTQFNRDRAVERSKTKNHCAILLMFPLHGLHCPITLLCT